MPQITPLVGCRKRKITKIPFSKQVNVFFLSQQNKYRKALKHALSWSRERRKSKIIKISFLISLRLSHEQSKNIVRPLNIPKVYV